MKTLYASITAAVFAAFLAGCVMPLDHSRVTYAANPLTVEEVKALAKANIGDDLIISQIKSTRTVYRLTSAQIIELKNDGISQKVLDYMINTPSVQSSVEAATVAPASPYYESPRYYVAPFPIIDPFPLPPPPFPAWHRGRHW